MRQPAIFRVGFRLYAVTKRSLSYAAVALGSKRSRISPARRCVYLLEAISFLLEQHGLKQKDLVDVFGTASIVSEVMNGKCGLTKEHVARLSSRFQVSPELFF